MLYIKSKLNYFFLKTSNKNYKTTLKGNYSQN